MSGPSPDSTRSVGAGDQAEGRARLGSVVTSRRGRGRRDSSRVLRPRQGSYASSSCGDLGQCCPKSSQGLQKPSHPLNSFDCVWARAVRFPALGLRITAMLEAFTALFSVISAGIFIAHAVDGYRSR
jgi:hypothetical protein